MRRRSRRYTARQLSGIDRPGPRRLPTNCRHSAIGLVKLVEFIRDGDEPVGSRQPARSTGGSMLSDRRRLDDNAGRAPDTGLGQCDDGGQRAILGLGSGTSGKRTGVCATVTGTVAVALRLSDRGCPPGGGPAHHPSVVKTPAEVPLLADPEPRCRAALVAVAGDDDPVVADEDLFRWLHDPDAGVRMVCHDALVSHDHSEANQPGSSADGSRPGRAAQISPRPALRRIAADPEPWLERLSRDIEPAVPPGAARVAVEVTADRRQSCPPWVNRIADADPDKRYAGSRAFFAMSRCGPRQARSGLQAAPDD